ncbi:MAG TPA: hypothetical protein VMZ92_09140 [Planctomycetota bacterium]|nr:hypothetical protein [Planctomycetota bacterium]
MSMWTVQVMGLVLLAAAVRAAAGERVYPGETWERKSPAEVGMDAAKLETFSNFVGGRGCVTRHGVMVHTWGDPAKRGDVASAAKPLYAHFLFRAIEDRKITSLDEKIVRYEPRLAALNADLGHKDARITWRHCATQTSCYGVSESPGTAFCYNDWQMALFWDCLFKGVYGATFEDVDVKVLRPLLSDPIGCEDRPTLMAFGTKDRAGRAGISPRDFCRFGLLYLCGGTWRDRQLISAAHARQAVTGPLPNTVPRSRGLAAAMLGGQRSIGSRSVPDNQGDHLGSYSFLWWTNGTDRKGRRHWPDAPLDAYGCFGHGGPRAMVVIPSLDVVLSWNDARNVQGPKTENHALRLLVDAVTDRNAKGNAE